MQPENHADHSQILRSVPLLARLDADDTRALGRLGQLRRFQAGSTLFTEGDPGDSLHVVLEGRVTVSVLSEDGDEAVLETFGPGECFGEMALFDGLPRSGTARADTATRSLVLARNDFLSWLESRPAAARALLATLSLRLRMTSDRVTDRQFLTLAQRLIKEILRGHDKPDPLVVSRTQAELGTALGVSRESVNKTLRGLEREGLLTIGRGRVEIEDPGRLRQYV